MGYGGHGAGGLEISCGVTVVGDWGRERFDGSGGVEEILGGDRIAVRRNDEGPGKRTRSIEI